MYNILLNNIVHVPNITDTTVQCTVLLFNVITIIQVLQC